MKGTTKQSDVTIGLDLGDRRSQSAVLDAAGALVEQRSIGTTKLAMAQAFMEYEGSLVVMEVGTHSPWVSRLLTARGFTVITANRRQVRLISESQHKTVASTPRCWRDSAGRIPRYCHLSSTGASTHRGTVHSSSRATDSYAAE